MKRSLSAWAALLAVSVMTPRTVTDASSEFLPGKAQSRLSRDGAFWVETVKGIQTVAPKGLLRVSTLGPVSLTGGDEKVVAYTLVKRVRARTEADARKMLERFLVRAENAGDTLSFQVSHGGADGQSADLELEVPRSLRKVTIETHGGDVEATALDGSLTAMTGGGRITLERIAGPVEVKTAGGEIEIGSVSGSVKAVSAGGVIHAATIRGEASFETGGGGIEATEVGGAVRAITAGGDITIGKAGGAVTANTAGGTIQLGEVHGPVTAETLGGSIQVGSAAGVRCETAGGAIRLTNVSGSLVAATAVGNIVARLARGRALLDSHLSTSAGDIYVFIPSNYPVTIKAQNERTSNTRTIVSDFPGIVIRGQGTLALAEGSINGGGPVLTLSGMGGTIFIKRQD